MDIQNPNRIQQLTPAVNTEGPKAVLAPQTWILPVVLVAIASGLSAVAAITTGPLQVGLGIAATVVTSILGALGYASNGIKK